MFSMVFSWELVPQVWSVCGNSQSHTHKICARPTWLLLHYQRRKIPEGRLGGGQRFKFLPFYMAHMPGCTSRALRTKV